MALSVDAIAADVEANGSDSIPASLVRDDEI